MNTMWKTILNGYCNYFGLKYRDSSMLPIIPDNDRHSQVVT